jgi:hypothetical protein
VSDKQNKRVSVRSAEEKDAQTYIDWLGAASGINLVDYNVYSYPTCNTAVVEKDGEPVLMNSVHLVLMQEALAPKPGVSPMDMARALRGLHEALKGLAQKSGVKEIWFGCKDESTCKFAERHGFERVPFPVFRMKV